MITAPSTVNEDKWLYLETASQLGNKALIKKN